MSGRSAVEDLPLISHVPVNFAPVGVCGAILEAEWAPGWPPAIVCQRCCRSIAANAACLRLSSSFSWAWLIRVGTS